MAPMPYMPGCTGKRPIPSLEQAVRVKNLLRHKAWYYCRHCTFWHTTTRGKLRSRGAEG